MNANALPGLVLILTVLLQIWVMAAVGRQRGRSGIHAPAMTGDPALERAIRVHANTIEQVLMFLPSFYLCLSYWGAWWAGIPGLIWVGGRVWYAIGYWQDPKKRSMGFLVSALATVALLAAGIVGWLRALW